MPQQKVVKNIKNQGDKNKNMSKTTHPENKSHSKSLNIENRSIYRIMKTCSLSFVLSFSLSLSVKSSQSSAAVDAAYDEPYEDPPGTEESDDTVQEVVRTVTLDIHCAHLRTQERGGEGIIGKVSYVVLLETSHLGRNFTEHK